MKKFLLLGGLMMSSCGFLSDGGTARQQGEYLQSMQQFDTEAKLSAKDLAQASRFENQRVGIAYHWGLPSLAAGYWKNENLGGFAGMLWHRPQVNQTEYQDLAKQWLPKKFDARDWVRTAQLAGANYVLYSARCPDGFSSYRSQYSDFDFDATPAGQLSVDKDPARELAREASVAGMDFGFSYSLAQMREKGQLLQDGQLLQAQVLELAENFGRVRHLRFTQVSEEQQVLLEELEVPQGILAAAEGATLAENKLVLNESRQTALPLAEVQVDMRRSRFFHRGEKQYLSPKLLVEVLCRSVADGGNMLIHVGPDADGNIPEAVKGRLQVFGNWMRKHQQALKGTLPLKQRLVKNENVCAAQKVDAQGRHFIYLMVLKWPVNNELHLPAQGVIREAEMMNAYGKWQPIPLIDRDQQWKVLLPERMPDRLCTIVRVELTKKSK